jgi:hypothetical protein
VAPNGLIFLVVVAIWAAYLVQYWIRRREHLATARSMDRFSESMRVLARRSPLPQATLESPSARSYAVGPARSMRPQVLVKRADVTSSASVMANQAPGARDSAYAGPSAQPAMSGSAPHGTAPASAGRAVRRNLAPVPSGRVSRRIRGLVLLAQLVIFVAVTVLAVVGLVAWWSPLLAVVAIGCAVVWIGEGVRAQRAAARMAHGPTRVRPPMARPAVSGAAVPASGPANQVVGDRATEGDAAGYEGVDGESGAAELPYGFEAPVADVASGERPPVAPAAHLVDEDDIPLTWDPRPVPRPTYTMKARVDRALPPPADVTPTPIGVDEDDDVRALEPQRHTG